MIPTSHGGVCGGSSNKVCSGSSNNSYSSSSIADNSNPALSTLPTSTRTRRIRMSISSSSNISDTVEGTGSSSSDKILCLDTMCNHGLTSNRELLGVLRDDTTFEMTGHCGKPVRAKKRKEGNRVTVTAALAKSNELQAFCQICGVDAGHVLKDCPYVKPEAKELVTKTAKKKADYMAQKKQAFKSK